MVRGLKEIRDEGVYKGIFVVFNRLLHTGVDGGLRDGTNMELKPSVTYIFTK